MAAGSPGKTPGFLRDFSGLGGEAKMQAEQLLRFGPYRFDLGTAQVRRGKQEVKLTPKALALLHTLVIRSGQVVTKDELFQAVWPDTVVSDDALTSCMQELRRAGLPLAEEVALQGEIAAHGLSALWSKARE